MTDKQQIEQLKEALQRYVAVYGKTQLQADGLYTTAELMSKFGIMALPKNSVVVDKEYLKKELQGLELQTRKETIRIIQNRLVGMQHETLRIGRKIPDFTETCKMISDYLIMLLEVE